MRSHKYIKGQVFKMFLFIGFLLTSSIGIYSQDEMLDAIVSIDFTEVEDSKTIIATAVDQEGIPIEDLELYFYVQRTFSLLPIGDDFYYTDEEGIIEVEFPLDLPGDENGNVIIVTKLIESDIYNDLTIEKTKNWGIPIEIEDQKNEKRSLWAAAANAPMSLIFIVSALILSVWYIICYILYKLYRISKIKPLNT